MRKYDYEQILEKRYKENKEAGKSSKGRYPKYIPEMCGMLLELMGAGKSIVQVAAALGVCQETIYKWEKDVNKPEFTKALRLGRTLSQAAHEQLMDDLITGKMSGVNKGSVIGQMFRLKCRFRQDWQDRVESKIEITNSTTNLTDDELEQQLALLASKDKK